MEEKTLGNLISTMRLPLDSIDFFCAGFSLENGSSSGMSIAESGVGSVRVGEKRLIGVRAELH